MSGDDVEIIVHNAGRMVDLVQRCTRCGAVICDYRNAVVPVGEELGSGFAEGPVTTCGMSTMAGEAEGAVRCGVLEA